MKFKTQVQQLLKVSLKKRKIDFKLGLKWLEALDYHTSRRHSESVLLF
jgi:hypothetical protein